MLSSGDTIGLVLVYGYVAFVVLLALYLDRRGVQNCMRKTVHILIGNIVFFWWIFDSEWVMSFMAAAPFIPILYLVSPHSSSRFLKGTLLGRATCEGHNLGLVFYAISWTTLAFLFFNHRLAASIGIISMSFGDGMGGFIGQRYGKRRLLRDKTKEGTLAILLTTIIASIAVMAFYQLLDHYDLFAGQALSPTFILIVSVLMGGYVALVELLVPGKYDNLVIPISVTLILIALGL